MIKFGLPFASLHMRQQDGSPVDLLEPSEEIWLGFSWLPCLLKSAQSGPEKMCLNMCHQCFCQYGKDKGFIKVD